MNEKSNSQDLSQAGNGSRRAGEVVKESDRLFSMLSQISMLGIFRTDVAGNYLYVNERWCMIAGMKQSVVLAGGWARAIHPDDRDRVAIAWYTSKQARLNFNLEYRIQRPDGEVRWVLGQAAAEQGEAGEVVGYMGTIADITQFKQAEELLRKSETKYHTLYDSTTDAVMLLDEKGFFDCNKATLAMFGCASKKEFCSKHPADLSPPVQPCGTDSLTLANRHIATAMKNGSNSFEWVHKRADNGITFFADVLLSAMELDGKRVLQATVRDITERKKLEEERQEALLRLQKIASQIPGVLYQFRLRSDGSICVPYASEAAREIYRLNPEEILEDASMIFADVHPDDLEGFKASIQDSARDLTPWNHEYRLKFDDGTVRWLLGNSIPQREADGSTLWHGFLTDITERKLVELALAESERRFREIFNTVSDAIFIHDAETGRILDVNRRMLEMYGITHEEALACGVNDLSAGTPPYSTAEAIEKIYLARTEGPQTFIWRARARDGHLFWVEVSLQFAVIGSQQRILATVRDITERKKAEVALQESEYRWKFALEGSGDGLWDWNMADNTVFFSRRWKEMLGYSEDEIGNGLDEWEKRIHPDDKADTLATVQAYLDGKTPVYQSEHRVSCKDGNWKWILDRGMVVSRNEQGKPLRMIGTHADITERKRAEEQIHNLAFYDTLTQLPNRRMLNDRMNQAMASSKRSGRYGALLFLDLDNFKPLNDTYGHAVGDLLLKEVARRISSCLREMDTVARFGGDEFVVMLTELDVDSSESAAQAGIVAEKIRIILAEPYVLKVQQEGKADTTVEHHCTSSIGVVLFIDHKDSPEDIIKWADMAMYQAKEDGRNLIRFYTSRD